MFWSPFSSGFIKNWVKVIFWPRKMPSRISHELNLKSNSPEEFERLRKSVGDKNLPEDIQDQSVVIYSSAFI